MGWTYEIEAWEPYPYPDERYHYVTKWTGESFLAAIWNLIKVKRQGFGCVTLHWR